MHDKVVRLEDATLFQHTIIPERLKETDRRSFPYTVREFGRMLVLLLLLPFPHLPTLSKKSVKKKMELSTLTSHAILNLIHTKAQRMSGVGGP